MYVLWLSSKFIRFFKEIMRWVLNFCWICLPVKEILNRRPRKVKIEVYSSIKNFSLTIKKKCSFLDGFWRAQVSFKSWRLFVIPEIPIGHILPHSLFITLKPNTKEIRYFAVVLHLIFHNDGIIRNIFIYFLIFVIGIIINILRTGNCYYSLKSFITLALSLRRQTSPSLYRPTNLILLLGIRLTSVQISHTFAYNISYLYTSLRKNIAIFFM